MHFLALGSLLAQAPANPGGGLAQFVPFLLIVVVFYLLLIRPQQRKTRAHQALVQSIGVGDRIVTIGGIHATVQSLDDDTAVLEIAPGTAITLTRGAIARRLVEADADQAEDAETEAIATDAEDTPFRD